jgi:fibronectin-binding autotransporter adhesin
LLSSNFNWGFLLLPEHVPAFDQTVQHRSASRSVSLQRLVASLLLFSAISSGKALASYDMKTGGVYAASSLGGNPIFKGGTLQLNSSTTISSGFTVDDYSTNTIDADGNTTTLSGAITGVSGPLTFTDSVGGGNVILTNSGNTYSGVTTINSGALLSMSGAGVISESGVIDNGTFDISQATSSVSIISLSGSGAVNLGAQGLILEAATDTFSGTISGTGSLTLTAGAEELGGTNTYTGGTIINAGTLTIGDGTTNGSIVGNVNDAGTLGFNRSDSVSFAGTISGKGAVTQSGSGTTILTAANSYTGVTTITQGTLALSGAGSIATSSSVADNGTFDVSATNGAAITALTGTGTVQLGAQTLTLTAGSGTFSGTITGSGGLTISGGSQILSSTNSYTGATTITGGTLEIGASAYSNNVTDSGTLGFYSISSIAMTGVVSGTGGLSQLGAGVTTISVAQSYTGPTTIAAGTLALTGSANIASSSVVADAGVFDISGTGGTSITSLSGTGTVVLGAQNLTVTAGSTGFSGIITGTGGLTVTGGNQTISGNDSYTGATTISGGTLLLTGANSLGTSSNVIDNGTLDISGVTGSVSGISTTILTLSGSGQVLLGAKNLVLTAAANTFSGVISGTGGLVISGGTETLTGNNSYTGNTLITAGTLALAGSGAISGTSSVSDSGVFDISATGGASVSVGSLGGSGTVNLGAQNLTLSNAQDTFSGVISGAGSLTISNGTEILAGTNTYTGVTTVAGGATLQVGSAAGNGAIAGAVADNGTLVFGGSGTNILSGIISGSGTVVQSGSGTTILAAANSYSGGTTISAGTLQLGNGGTTGSIPGNVTDNGILAFARSGTTSFDGVISGSGGVTVVSGTTVLTAADSYTGTTTINSSAGLVLTGTGSISASSVTDNGTLDVSVIASPQIASLAGSGGVTLGGNTLTIAGGTGAFSGSLTGTGGLTVNGGTETLSGSNGYTGATTINGGTLAVSGSILNSSGVTVNSGGTLAGSGSVSNVTVNSGGAIQAGVAAAGTLNVNGTVAYASGANTVISVSSASAGKIAISGAESLAGTLSIASADGTYPLGQKLTVLTANGGVSGAYTLTQLQTTGAQFASTLSYDARDVYLQINLAKLSPLLPAGASRNEITSVGGIDAAIAAGNTLPAAFESLGNVSSATLGSYANDFASQIGANVAQAGRALFDPFVTAIFDHVADTQLNGALSRRQPQPDGQIWGEGFAGANLADGQSSFGTDKFTSTTYGFAGGADWALSRQLRLGGAISVGSSNFHVADNQGTGHANGYQAGLYGLDQFGAHVYGSFAAALAFDSVTTNRIVTTTQTDSLSGKLNGFMVGGRYETGVEMGLMTPYIAVADDFFNAPSYSEAAVSGASTFALTYASHSSNDPSTELGIRQRGDVSLRGWTLKFSDRFAWLHDFAATPQTDAAFTALPNSTFVNYGAGLAKNAGLVSIGVAAQNKAGFGLDFHVDTMVAANSHSYTGIGGLKFAW